MANQMIYLSGKCKHAKLVNPDTKFDKDGVWSIVLYPDQESLAKIQELKNPTDGTQGIMNHLKKDDDGHYMTFKRPTRKDMGRGGIKVFTPPLVLNKDNSIAGDIRIGHGSDVTLKIEVRKYTVKGSNSKGTAVRLEVVRINELIPYTPDQFNEQEAKQTKGMAEQPTENIF